MTKSEDSKEKLIKAAKRLFDKYGYARATTALIAKEAGCNQALINYHFGSKEGLFDEINSRYLEKMADRMKQNSPAADKLENASFRELLTSYISLNYDMQCENTAIISYFCEDILNGRSTRQLRFVKLISRHLSGFFEILKVKLNESIERGEIRRIEFPDLILSILSLNIAPFIISNTFRAALRLSAKEYKAVMSRRKEENIRTILSRLNLEMK